MKKICVVGFFVVSLLGTLFHFTYDLVPIFIFPKNESIFEHTKLIFMPMLIYYFISFYFLNNKKRMFTIFITSILIGILLVVSIYYIYSGILGFDNDIINVMIYYVAVLIMFLNLYKEKTLLSFTNSVVICIIIFILMIVFTYYPLNIAFFN